jgi:hypothetical protein
MNDITGFLALLCFLLAGALFLLALCRLALAARRAAKLSRRLLLGLPPLILCLLGLLVRIPLECRVDTFHATLDLGWLFVVPLVFGLVGIFGAKHESMA